MESVGAGNGVTSYHLSVLVREEFIVTRKDGLHRRFFPLGHPDRKKKFFPSRIQKEIIRYVKDHPGSSQTSISRGLGESKQVINYHIKVLAEKEILAVDNRGRRSACYVKKLPDEFHETHVQVLAVGTDS